MATDDEWRSEYLITPAIRNPGERAALYREAARGRFVRVTRGAYLPAESWEQLDVEGRHRARMRAIELLRPGTVFSHLSAALTWGLPVVGGDIAIPHSVSAVASGGRSMNGLRRHAVGVPDDIREIGGLLVTSPHATAVHVAAGYAPEVSVPLLDALLARPDFDVSRAELAEAARVLPASEGPARGAWAVEFADASSGSPGESVSRVGIHRLGLPAPELQVRFDDASGFVGIVDFWWPDRSVIGEFDGIGKYLREAFTHGRDVAEVVLEEKHRENRLRALGPRVARWDWRVARNLEALRRRLSEAGLRAR
jgi:hypothetical protein